MLRAICLLTLLVLFAIPVQADEPLSVRKSVPDPAGTAEVRFADGSTVRMELTQSEVEITTRYGKLKVPLGDIRRIEFGFRYPPGLQAKIDAGIDRLAGDDVNERERAAKELEGHGAIAYSALKRMSAGTQTDTATRALAIVRKLEEKHGADQLKGRDQDVIHATEFVLAGRIESQTLKGRTTYFGDVAVQVSEVRTIRLIGSKGGEIELVIDAAKFAATTQDVWLDTELEVGERTSFEILAAGIVDLWPQGGNYKVGPDAMPRQGTSQDGNPSGMLLGRIGERGKTFRIGARYTSDTADGGRLYLRIACSPWNNASSGSYTVKINPNAEPSETVTVTKPVGKRIKGGFPNEKDKK